MGKVIVLTQTYNSEIFIERTINSVLRQTHGNLEYRIADNNSTDATREIIRYYTKKDKRIIPIFCDANLEWQVFTQLLKVLNGSNSGDFFIVLDPDDEYADTCFEKLLNFMRENNLDIAACRSDFIDGVTGDNVSRDVLKENFIVSGSGFEELYPRYFKFVRDLWGKMFRLSLFEHLNFGVFDYSLATGSVSILSFAALENAQKFGVLAEPLHKYYINPNSLSRSFSIKKLITPMLYSYYRSWLIKKCGRLSDNNANFLYCSYFRAIKAKLNIILDSQSKPIEPIEKLNLLRYIFNSEITTDGFEFIFQK